MSFHTVDGRERRQNSTIGKLKGEYLDRNEGVTVKTLPNSQSQSQPHSTSSTKKNQQYYLKDDGYKTRKEASAYGKPIVIKTRADKEDNDNSVGRSRSLSASSSSATSTVSPSSTSAAAAYGKSSTAKGKESYVKSSDSNDRSTKYGRSPVHVTKPKVVSSEKSLHPSIQDGEAQTPIRGTTGRGFSSSSSSPRLRSENSRQQYQQSGSRTTNGVQGPRARTYNNSEKYRPKAEVSGKKYLHRPSCNVMLCILKARVSSLD